MLFLLCISFLLTFQNNPLANIKRIDCALLPPCRRTLQKKLQRAHYVTVLWNRADTAYPGQDLSPTDYGWSADGTLLFPTWFEGPAIPDVLFGTGSNNNKEAQSDRNHAKRPIDHDMEGDEISEDEVSDDEPWSEDSESDLEDNE